MTTTLARDVFRDRNPCDRPEHGSLPGLQVEESHEQLGRPAARLVLDPHFVLDEVIARLVRDELTRGGTLQVVFVLSRWRWSLAADTLGALVARRGRIDQARTERIEELLRIAGDRSGQVAIVTKFSGCGQPREQALRSYEPSHHDYEDHP